MTPGAPPLNHAYPKKTVFDISSQYYITFRNRNTDIKYYLKGFTDNNVAIITGKKRSAMLFEDLEATKLCKKLREKYKSYIIGKDWINA